MTTQPVLFLDIDGVMNNHQDLWNNGVDYICNQKVEYLKAIIDATGALIVLSSDWRKRSRDRALVAAALAKHGLQIYSCTPKDLRTQPHQLVCRREEIKWWRDNNEHVGKYAILDDLDDARPLDNPECFFMTDMFVGLTPEIASKIIEHLTCTSTN